MINNGRAVALLAAGSFALLCALSVSGGEGPGESDLPADTAERLKRIDESIGTIEGQLKALRTEILTSRGPDEGKKLKQLEDQVQKLKDHIGETGKLGDKVGAESIKQLRGEIDLSRLLRSSMRPTLLGSDQLLSFYKCDRQLSSLQTTAACVLARDRLEEIKKGVLSVSVAKIVEQGYKPGNGPGQLTKALLEVASVNQELSECLAPSFDEMAASEELHLWAAQCGELSERISAYRAACFSQFVIEQVSRARQALERKDATREDKIQCYLQLTRIQLPPEGLTYGVAMELSEQRQKIFNSLDAAKAEANQRLVNSVLDAKLSSKEVVTANDF